jgi:Ca2+-binding EF-hand superfamily protein
MGVLKMLAVALALATVSPAYAIDQESMKAFTVFDTNGDGYITEYEGPKSYSWEAGLFEMKDLNEDGKISKEEFDDWQRAPETRILNKEILKEDKLDV